MTELRLSMLLSELEDIEWDLIIVTETWRESKKELLRLGGGHLWYRSGGSNGIGFLVSVTFPKHTFIAVSERHVLMDADLLGASVRITAVYMPSTICTLEEMEAMRLQCKTWLARGS